MKFALLAILTAACTCSANTRLEAENAQLGKSAQRVAAADSSGGAHIVLTHSTRIDDPSTIPASAVFTFTAPAALRTQLRLRVKATSQGNDSLWYARDDQPFRQLFIGQHGQWTDLALPLPPIQPGEHSLKLTVRENGCAVDCLDLVQQELLPASAATLYPTPPVTPPAEHPRVLLRPADLPALRQRLHHPQNQSFWQLVQQRASADNGGILDPTKHRGKAGLFDANILTDIQCLAFLALVNHDDATGKRAIAAMTLFLDKVDFQLDFQDVTRQMGQTIYTAALVYDWCYPLLTDEHKQHFINRAEEITALMEIGCPPTRQGNITGHSGEAQLFRDLLSFGIACYDEKPTLYQVCAGRFFHHMVPPRQLFMASGRHHQGCCYGPYRLHWEVFAALLFKRMAGLDVFPPEAVRSQLNGIIFNLLPDDWHFTNGDCYRGKTCTTTLLAIAAYCHDPMAKGEFIRQKGLDSFRRDPVTFLLFNEPELAAAERRELPLTTFFSEPLGGMIARSGWGMGPRADVAIVDMRGAGCLFGNHQHPDAGAFQIYHRAPLAIDPGQYGKYGTDYDMLFNKQSIAHNVLLIHDPDEKRPTRSINDGGQRLPNQRREPSSLDTLLNNDYQNGAVTAHAIGPDHALPIFSHLKCDIAKAYSDKIREYTRSFVYFNTNLPDAPGMLVVFDRVLASNPNFRKEWTVNSYRQPDIASDRIRIAYRDDTFDGTMEVIPLLPTAAQRTITSSPSVVVGEQSFTPPRPELPSTNSVRTSISPTAAQAEDLFLNVLPIGKHPNGWQARLLELNGAIGVDVQEQYLATFARDGKHIRQALRLDLPGERLVLITDLAEGPWTIRKNQQPWAKCQVAKSNHCLFFQADKASYELVPNGPDAPPLPPYEHLRAIPGGDDNALFFNDQLIQQPSGVVIRDGLAYISIATMANLAGATWQNNTLQIGDFNCQFQPDSAVIRCQGLPDLPISAPARDIDGVLYAPLAELARLLRFRAQSNAVGGIRLYNDDDKRYAWLVAAYEEKPNREPVSRALDGNPNSYWAQNAKPATFTAILAKPETIAGAEIAWHRGNERSYT
ncbi:MAG: heparinase II/III family protein, partial [Lentisphaeria bacterium]|nr:heparinase II/III family protein [Lentisphaeria bacterium]